MIYIQLILVISRSNYQGFTVLYCYTYVNSSHTFIIFLTLNSLETDLQKSADFLLYPSIAFQNDLYKNLLYYMYTCCYTKMK